MLFVFLLGEAVDLFCGDSATGTCVLFSEGGVGIVTQALRKG